MIEWDGAEVTSGELAPLLASTAANYGNYTAFGVSAAGTVRGLDLHLERLRVDSETLSGRAPDPGLVLDSLRRVATSLAGRPAMLRATVFGPELHLLVAPRAASPLPPGGLRVRTVAWVRDLPRVKHLGLFAASWHRKQAQAAGFDDALFVDAAGRVAEGPTWNVAVSLGGELVWPDDACLPGTTRTLLQSAADAAGIPWSSGPVSESPLGTTKALFATSAGIGVRPITEIDGRPVPGDPELLRALQEAYATLPSDQLT